MIPSGAGPDLSGGLGLESGSRGFGQPSGRHRQEAVSYPEMLANLLGIEVATRRERDFRRHRLRRLRVVGKGGGHGDKE